MTVLRKDQQMQKSKIAKSTLDKEIQNKIMTSMNNLKEQRTLLSSL